MCVVRMDCMVVPSCKVHLMSGESEGVMVDHHQKVVAKSSKHWIGNFNSWEVRLTTSRDRIIEINDD